MKLKEIAAMCKKDKRIVVRNIVNNDGVVTQWIGTYQALYRISGIPYLGETAIYRIFDIPEDKTCDYSYTASDINPEDEEYKLFVDFAPGDAESQNDLTKSNMDIYFAPNTYNLFCYELRYIFILAQYLGPAKALDSADYFKRYSAVAVKQGMLIEGLIFPVPAWKEDKIRNGIRRLANCLDAEKRDRDYEAPEESYSFSEKEEETGSSGKVRSLIKSTLELPDDQQQMVIDIARVLTDGGTADEEN